MDSRSRVLAWHVPAWVTAVIIVAGGAAIAVWPGAWWWLTVTAAAAAVAAPMVLAKISEVLQQSRTDQVVVRAGLVGAAGRGGGALPYAADAPLGAHVHPTVLGIPYIRRDAEEEISDHLRAGRPVLLVGSSMVGKTKIAEQVILREFGGRRVVIPDSRTALAELDARDIQVRNSVIWLDDIDHLIGSGGITEGTLRRLAEADNVVLATIRAKAYDGFLPSSLLRPPEWNVLGVFERIMISSELSAREKGRLARAIGDPAVRERICAVGIGEYVGGAGRIAEALKLGAAGADPIGYALVLGAADWERSGTTRPVPAALLAPLAGPHLEDRQRAQLSDPDAYSHGLAWATREINPSISLLQPDGSASFTVYNYALDLLSGQRMPIPAESWDVIIAAAQDHELLDLAHAADSVYRQPQVALRAYGIAIESSRLDVAPYAAFNMAALLSSQGNIEDAKAAYQLAIDSGQADIAPNAALALGKMLMGRDVEAAAAAYQQAIDLGAADEDAWDAANALELLLFGDVERTKAVLQQVISLGYPNASPRAAFKLGYLLHGRDSQGAAAAYQLAIDFGRRPTSLMSAINLGNLCEQQGDIPGARVAYQYAIDSKDPGYVTMALVNLGVVLAHHGHVDDAIAALQEALDRGYDKETEMVEEKLRSLLARRERP